MQKALGLIETEGLVCAVAVADAAVKAANVVLLGYELTRGRGMVTVKLQGDVSAVQAAVSAGVAAGSKLGKVVSKQVIPRPHRELDRLIDTPDMVPSATKEEPPKEGENRKEMAETKEEELQQEDGTEGTEAEVAAKEEQRADLSKEEEKVSEAVCNLCGDPACPRRKGEPHSRCLHYQDKK